MIALPARPAKKDDLKVTQEALHKIRDILADNKQVVDININQTNAGKWFVEIIASNRIYRDIILDYIGMEFENALVIGRIPFFKEVQEMKSAYNEHWEGVPDKNRFVLFEKRVGASDRLDTP